MSYETIRYEPENGILTLKLHRPDRLNAFTSDMMFEMVDALDKADADDEIKVVVVTGSGRAFCAGADLAAGGDTFNAETNPNRPKDLRRDAGGRLTLRIFENKKPVIGAINGHAVGIGITMTLPMDIRLVADNAKIGFVFTRRGIVPEACSSWFLPRLVGISRALSWVYSGKLITADEALAGGLVQSVHSADTVLDAAYAIAQEIATYSSSVSVALSRQLMWQMLCADHPMEAHKLDSRGIFSLGKSKDAKEGVESFLEKREPDFTNQVSTDMPDFYPWWKERKFE